MLTFEELERVAYIQGNTMQAEIMQNCADLESVSENCDFDFELSDTIQDQIDLHVEKQIEKQCPNYAEFKQFFYDCFEMLNGHYPCPSVTSDYDCSIIFDAIRKGEQE